MDVFADHGIDLDVRGAFCFSVLAGQTGVFEFEFVELRHLTGIRYQKVDGGFEDKVKLEVVHVASNTVLRTLGTDVYVFDGSNTYDFYKATIPSGLKLRLTYQNTGILTAKFKANLILHKNRA